MHSFYETAFSDNNHAADVTNVQSRLKEEF